MIGIKEVFLKHQHTIRKIIFRRTALDEIELIQLLSLLPQLEEIEIETILSKSSSEPQSRLGLLERVTSFTCNANAAQLILELPNHVLKKLKITRSIFNVPLNIIKMQEKLECLDFCFPRFHEPEALKALKLKNLTFATFRGSKPLIETLRSQPNLISYSDQSPVTIKEVHEIFKLVHLQSLSINLTNINDFSIKSLNVLSQLKKLFVTIHSNTQPFKDLSLPKLEQFELDDLSTKETAEDILKLFPACFPALKVLKLGKVSLLNFCFIFWNKNLESLDIKTVISYEDMFKYSDDTKSLRSFKVNKVENSSEELLEFITFRMPSLRKLLLGEVYFEDFGDLEDLLISLNKLTHISIRSRYKVFGNNFARILKKHGNNLESFEFTTLQTAQTFHRLDENMMRSWFGTKFSHIIVTIDRVSMKNLK